MGLLNGISAQAFTDNFLKTYMAIGEDERAKEATNIAQQMAQAKLEEIAREKEMLAKMQAESTGFMSNPVQDVIPAQGQQMTGNFANSGLPAIQGNPGLMNSPTTQNYSSEFERIKANGGNPDQELFDRQARIGMMYDPKTFMPLVGRQQTAQDKMLNALLLNAATNATRRYGYDTRSNDVRDTNETKRDIASETNTTRQQIAANHDLMSKAIAALRANSYGGSRASNNQVDILAKGIIDGTVDPNGISKRGGLQAAVWSRVKEIQPDANIVELGASAAFEKNPGAMSTKALLNSIDPLLDALKTAHSELKDTGSPLLNAPMQWAQKNVLPDSMGGVKVTAFDNLRNDTIAEVERGLLNTGVLSDFKYQLGLQNLKSAQTQKQLSAAVDNIKTVVRARLEALEAGPYKDRGTTQTKQRFIIKSVK